MGVGLNAKQARSLLSGHSAGSRRPRGRN